MHDSMYRSYPLPSRPRYTSPLEFPAELIRYWSRNSRTGSCCRNVVQASSKDTVHARSVSALRCQAKASSNAFTTSGPPQLAVITILNGVIFAAIQASIALRSQDHAKSSPRVVRTYGLPSLCKYCEYFLLSANLKQKACGLELVSIKPRSSSRNSKVHSLAELQ